MALHNPNNWHWVSKPVGEWTQQWFGKTLTGISAEDGDVNAKITKVVSMDGDVDVNQRKGKVITIYDVKLILEYSGAAPGEEDVSGTITVPEVAHDTEEEEFVVCRKPNVEWKDHNPTNINAVSSKSTFTPRPRRSRLSKTSCAPRSCPSYGRSSCSLRLL